MREGGVTGSRRTAAHVNPGMATSLWRTLVGRSTGSAGYRVQLAVGAPYYVPGRGVSLIALNSTFNVRLVLGKRSPHFWLGLTCRA